MSAVLVPSASTSAQYELGLPVQTLPADAAQGRAIGREFARHGLTPPAEYLLADSPLREGWLAGRSSFAERTLPARRSTELWLQLRTHAWSRGRNFEEMLLTPNYLRQIDVPFCPITRQPLNERRGDAHARSVDRVRHDAGYAAGNLVVMSRTANAAKASHDHASALALAQQGPAAAGLSALEWQRIAVLTSYVTELPHAQAATLPMLVLPPNRLRLFNPIQALQALVTRQFATPGWSQRLARLEALLPSPQSHLDFNRFVLAMAPRMLLVNKGESDAQQIRWALEDAWQQALIQRRWSQFALQITPAQAEQLIHRAAASGLSPQHRVQRHGKHQSTDGWALERRGAAARPARPPLSRAGRH